VGLGLGEINDPVAGELEAWVYTEDLHDWAPLPQYVCQALR
jgi:hypothetical protein